MAAGGGSAANSSPYLCYFFCINVIFTFAVQHYSRSDLINIGLGHALSISSDFHRAYNIPVEIARPAGSPWIVAGPGRSRRRKRKRGCRAGLWLKLRKKPLRPPVPSLYLSSGRSSALGANALELEVAGDRFVRDCCVLLITETGPVPLAGRTLHRCAGDSGTSGGGGLSLYIHEGWCNNSAALETHRSTNLEFMTVRCRPFYLPRELTVVFITAVCIPPDADVNAALNLLLHRTDKHQRAHPNGVHIIAGEFSKANLQSVLPNFHRHPSGGRTLDHVYSNIEHAYRAAALPHLDHPPLRLVPAYSPLCHRAKPNGSLHQLQSCFETTRWDAVHHEGLTVFADTVLNYIQSCHGNVTVDQAIQIHTRQKPWMTNQVRMLLRARQTAFRSGDRTLYRAVRAHLRRAIKEAKAAYNRLVEDLQQLWQGSRHPPTIEALRGSLKS